VDCGRNCRASELQQLVLEALIEQVSFKAISNKYLLKQKV
jgi:hypothetical protein